MSHDFVGCMSHELWPIKVLTNISLFGSPTPPGGQKWKFLNLYFLVWVHLVTPKRFYRDKGRILEFGFGTVIPSIQYAPYVIYHFRRKIVQFTSKWISFLGSSVFCLYPGKIPVYRFSASFQSSEFIISYNWSVWRSNNIDIWYFYMRVP